jgi:hypothetical protein
MHTICHAESSYNRSAEQEPNIEWRSKADLCVDYNYA